MGKWSICPKLLSPTYHNFKYTNKIYSYVLFSMPEIKQRFSSTWSKKNSEHANEMEAEFDAYMHSVKL